MLPEPAPLDGDSTHRWRGNRRVALRKIIQYHVRMAHLERKYPARRAIDEIGNRSNLVFVTVCTRGRKPILATPDIHELLVSCWANATHWLVGRYVLMPDHLHLYCVPSNPESENVRNWIAFWKSRSASQWPRPNESPIWQREVWDRQVRRGESYSEKWEYVRNNPVRAGLVTQPEDWPYQGELNQFMWHDA